MKCSGTPIGTVIVQSGIYFTDNHLRCASRCIGTPECVAFNWELQADGSASNCYLLSSVGDCYEKDMKDYEDLSDCGNGQIELNNATFCSGAESADCQDIPVCQTMSPNGEWKDFVRLNHLKNQSKANGARDNKRIAGNTLWDAVRILQRNDGLYIDLNDDLFSRSAFTTNPDNRTKGRVPTCLDQIMAYESYSP